MMRHLFRALFALSLSAAAGAAAAAPIELEVGDSRTLSSRGDITQVIVDVPDVVATAAPSARRLRVTGEKPGRATVTLVSGRERSAHVIQVVEAGTLDAEELRRRLTKYPELERVNVDKRGEAYVLSGAVPDVAAHARATALAKAFAGENVTDLLEVEGAQMVAVDIRFVAISDTTLKALGFNFSKLGQGFEWAVVGPNQTGDYEFGGEKPFFETVPPLRSAFNVFLHDRSQGALGIISALSDAGLSQVLAQPTLLTRSGEPADFLAGGEVPIPVPQGGGNSGAIGIEYREYGVRLSVEPYVMSNNRIVLKLAPEVSELDQANRITIQGFSIPAFRRRSANTTVELGDGQSFVIAGLTYESSGLTPLGDPGSMLVDSVCWRYGRGG